MNRRLVVLTMTTLATLLASVAALAGCGPRSGLTIATYPAPLQRLAYRPDLEVISCLQFGGGYDEQSRQDAQTWLADGLSQAVRANSGTLAVLVRYIDAQPLAPKSVPLAVKLPAIPAYPAEPALEPTPTKTGQPWKDAKNAQIVQSHNQQTHAAYTSTLQQVKSQIAAAQDFAAQAATALSNLQPPQELGGDRVSIWGCVHAAALAFQAVSGDKVLVLATTANEESFADVSDLSGLKGVRVVAIDTECTGTANWCDWSRGTWQQVFSQAQVASQTWLDAGQTRVTSPSIIFDPQADQAASGS